MRAAARSATVAFVGVLLLYGQLFAYGYWVAAGVVEEKSSRVVEVLLATLRPSHLLRGKILGIGVLGLLQLLLIGLVGLFASNAVGSLEFLRCDRDDRACACWGGSSSASSSTRGCSRWRAPSSRGRRISRRR